ncbi:hypothetical protein SUGI_0031120 [Cryptomeria japonica]|uniref:gibberellin-regulated protein 6 n=1 Tax=Cryptomeria japonica TaxID=3369 RepID=UPI002408A8C4|nr:gibberellin-regulated protein 6 [Cryptomeria japonica]GLJ06061.1 hypothetical protein SUGI_0031120 [Cryptomeria japonica]
MAKFSKYLTVLLILVLFAVWIHDCEGFNNDVDSHQLSKSHNAPYLRLHRSECPSQCKRRCSKTRKTACMDFCQYCCKKCLCVPPGTYGNKEVCPCYNNWKTKEGGPKCP